MLRTGAVISLPLSGAFDVKCYAYQPPVPPLLLSLAPSTPIEAGLDLHSSPHSVSTRLVSDIAPGCGKQPLMVG